MRLLTPWNVAAWMCALVGAAWLAVAPAQTTQLETAPSPSDKPAMSVKKPTTKKPSPPTDAELRSFAGAVVEVHRINDAYIPRLKAADTADEEQKLEAAALREMVEAVENEGLSVEKYEEILTQAQTDRDLAYRLKRPLRSALTRQWT